MGFAVLFAVGLTVVFAVGLADAFIVAFTVGVGVGFFVAANAELPDITKVSARKIESFLNRAPT